MLDDRKAQVLLALVAEHIKTGEPVSSRAVLEATNLGVSAATIRNDLAALEHEGLVVQPHTSAGRVPTARAYRFYVDSGEPLRLRAAAKTKIQGFFSTMHTELGRLLKETSEMLAALSHYPAVVVGPGIASELVRGVHVVEVDPGTLMTVFVTNTGRVMQRVVERGEQTSEETIERLERFMSECLVGRTLGDGLGMAAPQVGDLPPDLAHLAIATIESSEGLTEENRQVFVGGTGQMAPLWEDIANIHHILALLERDAHLVGLLAEGPEQPTVRIGQELDSISSDIALVSSPYLVAGGEASGRLGVFGPMRMDYRRAISIVQEVSEGLTESLGSVKPDKDS